MNDSAYANAESGRAWGPRTEREPWSIYEIGAVVGGFAIFWPIGLVALYLRYKNGEVWKGASDMSAPWSQWKSPRDAADHFAKSCGGWGKGWQNKSWSAYSNTGNEAFDDYRKAKLEELEAMKRKLDEERAAFDDFLSKLRKAKDREDFERFMAERNAPATQA